MFVYTEAYQVTSKEIYARVARELISYLKRVLLDESGGFYTAEDADSEGKEGKFYLWDKSELKEILNSREYQQALDDYSFLLWGLLELHQATLDREFLLRAEQTAGYMLENYRDSGGGFFKSPAGEELPLNQKKVFDGALPSGNSLAATSLYSLFQLTDNNKYQEATRETLEWAAPQLEQNPVSHLQLLMVLDFYNRPFSRITIEGGAAGLKRN